MSQGHAAEPVGAKLTPKLRDLLSQDMNAVLGATRDILNALVRGDDAVVAGRVLAIRNSSC